MEIPDQQDLIFARSNMMALTSPEPCVFEDDATWQVSVSHFKIL